MIPSIFDTPNQDRDFTSVATPDQCFTQCQTKKYALLWANAGKAAGWQCGCLKDYPLIFPNIVNCTPNSRFLFQHAPQVSGAIARRNRRPKAIDGPEAYCLPGLEPCKVPQGGYECLDVKSELSKLQRLYRPADIRLVRRLSQRIDGTQHEPDRRRGVSAWVRTEANVKLHLARRSPPSGLRRHLQPGPVPGRVLCGGLLLRRW